nr:MAG TPA: hypothetical protein [Caudoviricetes sp.]
MFIDILFCFLLLLATQNLALWAGCCQLKQGD